MSAVAHNSAALNAIRPHVIISGGIIADSARNARIFFHQISVRHTRDVIADCAVQSLLLDPFRRSITEPLRIDKIRFKNAAQHFARAPAARAADSLQQ